MKRGLTQAEAMEYVGVKRRTWEAQWAPRLVALKQGVCRVFDRRDLDRIFDEMKMEAAGLQSAANDAPGAQTHALEQNGPRIGRPKTKGETTWANKRGASTPTKTTHGRSTRSGAELDFASVASLVLQKQKAG